MATRQTQQLLGDASRRMRAETSVFLTYAAGRFAQGWPRMHTAPHHPVFASWQTARPQFPRPDAGPSLPGTEVSCQPEPCFFRESCVLSCDASSHLVGGTR